MIILNQGNNEAAATCSRNKTLTGSVCYLWSMKHKLSGEVIRFVPYRIEPTVDYSPGYDLFAITINPNAPNAYLTGATAINQTSLNIYSGEYYVKIYEQSAIKCDNTNPSLAYDVVYEGIARVNYSASTAPVQYSGTTDNYIIYQG